MDTAVIPVLARDMDTDVLENHPFAEIRLGDSASLVRRVSQRDIQLFAAVSGDVNPAHVDARYAQSSHFHEIIAHGMLGASLISTVLGTRFPGPGTIYLGQSLKFLKPVHIGDSLTVTVTVTSLDPGRRRLVLETRCTNQAGEVVIAGEAEVMAPRDKLRIQRTELPEPLLADKNLRYEQLLAASKDCPRLRMGVVHPCSREALAGAIDAHRSGTIEAVLIGPLATLQSLAAQHQLDLSGIRLIDAAHDQDAAAQAVKLARAGGLDALMQGSLPSDVLMAEVGRAETGLRTERCISHVAVLDVPRYAKPLLISDTTLNEAPDLDTKADIVRNASDLAHALGITLPKVAVLSAAEGVSSTLRSAREAKALSHMAGRGQISGAVVDGPLTLDSAVSMAAAARRGVASQVAGDADILVVPDIDAGHLLARLLETLGDAQSAGLVMGAQLPIVLTRAGDSAHSRIASCALAQLWLKHVRTAAAPSAAQVLLPA